MHIQKVSEVCNVNGYIWHYLHFIIMLTWLFWLLCCWAKYKKRKKKSYYKYIDDDESSSMRSFLANHFKNLYSKRSSWFYYLNFKFAQCFGICRWNCHCWWLMVDDKSNSANENTHPNQCEHTHTSNFYTHKMDVGKCLIQFDQWPINKIAK